MSIGMEGTAVDCICISAYPFEQFIPQRNNTANNNEKSITEFGPSLDSTQQCAQWGLVKHFGAGANAGSRTEITSVANNPLSELVWSPHKGLSLKCADFSRAEKRSSIFWSTESGNMVVSPSQSIKAKDNDKDGTAGQGSYKGSADSLQFKPQESNFDSAPVQLKHEDSHKGTISSYLEESGDVGYRNSWHGGPTESLDSDSSAPKTHDCIRSPKPPSDGRQLNSTSASRENNGMENPKSIKLSSMDKPESSAENDVHISKAGEDGHAFAEVGIYGIASLPEEEGENILEKNLERPSLPTDVCPIESIPCGSGAPSTRQKGKEKILPGMDVDQNVSKEEDGSHESVESSNSGRKFSSGKRAWCFEQNLFITSKKMKKQCQETPCSTSLFGHDSSFMNYISNMMKGSSKFNQDETSPEISGRLAHHSRSHDSLVLLHDKTQDPSCRPTGFQSIFKSLYFPSLKVQEKETCSLNNQVHAESPKEPEVAKKTLCDGGSTHVSSNSEDDVKLLQLVHVSNLEVCQAGKSLSGQQDIPSANAIGVDGKLKRESKNGHTACNVMPGIELDARTSGSSFQNKSISPVEYKGFSKHDSPDQIKSSNSTTKRSNLLESLWITRFSPKFSQPLLNSHQCNLDTATAIEVSTDCNWFLPHSQNAVSTSNDPNHIENGHGSSAKDETNPASKNIQTFSMGHNASCGLKRNRAPGDLKFNSILSPILSSERFKKLEAMVSIFARRLEALKHINIVHAKTTESETHLSTICFFCGSRGHLLRDCSEIVESDLDDLLRNTNLYNGAEELPCLCIRCLQFNHWAIACPYAPSREQITATGSASLNSKCQVVGENAVSHWESSRATNELPVRTNVCGDASETIVLNGSSSAGKKDITGKTIVLNGSSSADKKDITGKTIILNGSSSAGKKDITGNDCICLLVEKNAFREFIINGKHASSEEKGLKGNEIVPISNVQRQMTNVPRGLFQAIRRLRLSRSDILKWIKSSVQEFTIEGFFIRLRLGKWEEGLGGTGYHVACINGVSQEWSCATCRTTIYVDVGGLKSFVDCQYVSNHDFLEDELLAWWCTSSKGDGRVPSEEALRMKLLERSTYAF